MTSAARLPLLAAGAAALVALAGCSANQSTGDADLVAGKKLFVQKCGSCHILNRAQTKGVIGPNLDTAFANALNEGFGETAIRGVIRQQIDIVRSDSKMPADLVTGDDAGDVSAYVARSVAKPGEDEGLLATAVAPAGSDKPVAADNGVLTIPADPNGQLLFVNSAATAPAGELTLVMPNDSGVPHNIAVDGKGESPIVDQGESKFTASFDAGVYEYVCLVEGHAAAGMVGKLTVK
ncbi:MAG: plastocyanin/azurin family copper-binding protein [Solirubrobacteraceae bacterium]